MRIALSVYPCTIIAVCEVGFMVENNDLKASGTGIYQEVFDTVDYDGVSGADVVDTLLDGMESVGYTIG